MEDRNVVVIGAGVIGLACAWRLAKTPRLAITIVDPAPGSGASSAAAGMLAPLTEAHPTEQVLLDLSLRSAQMFPKFVAELAAASGLDPGYRESGTLAVALDSDDRAHLDVLARHLAQLGLSAEPLAGRECRRLEPGLAPDIRSGLLVAGDHSIDNRALLRSLRAATERAGVRRITERADSIVANGRVSGVALADGTRIPADVVVVAAGCWSSALHESIGELIRPVKGEILRLTQRPGAVSLNRTVRARVSGHSVYLVPRDNGELVVGATQLEAGFDTTVAAGSVHAMLRDARQVFPSMDEYALTEIVAGLRPGSPDNAPLIGSVGPEGLIVASGHHRDGILLTPITAEAVAGLVTTGLLTESMDRFSPDRFVRGGQ